MADWKPDIYAYLNYRSYLGDYYRAAKANSRAFSYRWFSRRAGFASPNFLKLVIDGHRNLGPDSVGRFSDALGHDTSAAEFFADLVAFGQAESADEKNEAFERVAASRRFRTARRIDRAYFDYLSNWYYPAIREMVARVDFREDAVWIARQLVPRISAAQARRALEILLELGLLERDAEGRLTRGDASLTTGHEVRSLAVGNYHRQMLERAADSIDQIEREQRDISALTVCVRPERVAELKTRIQGFREVLLDLCDRDESPTVVYQLNLQLFPLTRSGASDDERDPS